MPGLRHYVKELGEICHHKERLFAAEQEKHTGRGVVLRRPSDDLLALFDTRQEMRAVVKVCTRSI